MRIVSVRLLDDELKTLRRLAGAVATKGRAKLAFEITRASWFPILL
jgi:hypothetical protein